MIGIVIVDKNWNIGFKGQLLTHLPKDLAYFKEKTLGKTIVYGRKTLESFPGAKPLPGRTNIILTNNPDYKNPDCIVCCGETALFEELSKYDEDEVFLAGGSSLYKQFLAKCKTVLVTKMDAAFEADSSFLNLDEMEDFVLVDKGTEIEEKGIKFRFTKYERK